MEVVRLSWLRYSELAASYWVPAGRHSPMEVVRLSWLRYSELAVRLSSEAAREAVRSGSSCSPPSRSVSRFRTTSRLLVPGRDQARRH